VEEIEPVAQGRVWSGQRALSHGLIDATGGIDAALELLRKKAGIQPDEMVRLVVFPAPKNWFDIWFRPAPQEEAGHDTESALLMRRLPRGLAPWLAGGFLRVLPYEIQIR
jgi:protease-4